MENINSRLNIAEISNIDTVADTDCWKIVCVLNGTLCVTLGGSVYRLESKDIAFCAPKDYFCISQTENADFCLINLVAKGELLGEYESRAVTLSEQESLIAERIYDLKDELSDAIKYQELCILLELLMLRCYTKQSVTAVKTDKDAVIFNNATEILKKNVANQISVTQLANKLDISLSHLKRIFTKYARVGVHEYFTYLKIAEAKRLLKEGESVTRTAEITGFANQAYFSAAFKRITGISPKDFAVNIKAVKPKLRKSKLQNPKAIDLPEYLL